MSIKVFGIRRWRTAKVGVIQGVVQPGKTEKKHEIEALEGFDWKHTEPRKLRPYKPKYNITMGKQHLSQIPQYILQNMN